MKHIRIVAGLIITLLAVNGAWAASPKAKLAPIISQDRNGNLNYDKDEQGNRVPDFSYCGYAGGDRAIPDASVRVVVSPGPGDSTARIQKAINYVASLPLDANGLRGAVLLLKGRHEVSGHLSLTASGVVLRGQGMGEDGTVLVATGVDRRDLIQIAGRNDRKSQSKDGWQVKDDYVPVGTMSFRLKDVSGLKAGDAIRITRPSTREWIDDLGMNEFGGGIGDSRIVWHVGTRNLVWDRVIKSVAGDLVTVDAPITTALETKYGGGTVELYEWPGRISRVGVENLRCESTYDANNPKDENHSWTVVALSHAENCWVRRVTAKHFAGSLAAVWESCKWVTVEDCISLQPVSEEGGYRRHTFFTMGQMTLFLRCASELGWHDFSVGHCAAGPNAFVQCEANLALRDSGPIDSWAAGVLYDNVRIDGQGLTLGNRGSSQAGSGWAAANSVLWQCSAALARCEAPPTAQNWAFGCWSEFAGDGVWRSANSFVDPDSLYVGQLGQRLGATAAARVHLLSRAGSELTNPSVEQAAKMIAQSRQPAEQLPDYIVRMTKANPIPSDPGGAKSVDNVAATFAPQAPLAGPARHIAITNGWIVCDGRLLAGGSQGTLYWRGTMRPGEEAPQFGPNPTRFAPGRTGPGWTDDLEALAGRMVARGLVSLDYNYGLWYERRRDDHERVRRMDGSVWAPFYEQPFARTGHGRAWEGLSQYDLTKYNSWYWGRLKTFADICDQRGLVLFHQNFLQHNILEAGAHWADSPWRSTNNINGTGFPEPPPYAGDKRIFMAEQFYDVTNPARRPLLRAYIRQCLENFKDNANVIQFTSAEYTGPLGFVQFWLDTIAEWEQETGRHALVALSCPKDVQDAILADPKRSPVVDVINFKYWWQRDKGLFAPAGGQNLSPRQFERKSPGGPPSDLNLARMAAEYREKYPGKAIVSDFNSGGWAFLCAGGSIPNLPAAKIPGLLAALPRMTPLKPAADAKDQYVLAEAGKSYLVYAGTDAPVRIDLTKAPGQFTVQRVDERTGGLVSVDKPMTGGAWADLKLGPGVFWLQRQGN